MSYIGVGCLSYLDVGYPSTSVTDWLQFHALSFYKGMTENNELLKITDNFLKVCAAFQKKEINAFMLIHLINGAVTGIDCNLFSYKIIKNKKGKFKIIDVIPENINDYKLILQYIVEHFNKSNTKSL